MTTAAATATSEQAPPPWEVVPKQGWKLLQQVKDTEWKAMYLVLANFRKTYGHVNVTGNIFNGQQQRQQLRTWLQEQQGKLYQDFVGIFEGFIQIHPLPDMHVMFCQVELLRLLGVVFGKETLSSRGKRRRGVESTSAESLSETVTTTTASASSNSDNNNNNNSNNKSQAAVKRKADWEANLQAIREFRDVYGHCDPPDLGLKRWVERQRKRLRGTVPTAAPLQPDQIQRLQDVGIATFTRKLFKQKLQAGGVQDDSAAAFHSSAGRIATAPKSLKDPDLFEEKFAEMKEFYQQTGHCVVPHRCKLRGFLEDIRREYKKIQAGGTSPYLTAARTERLKQIGFSFVARPKHSWDERLAQWVEYHKQSGGKHPNFNSTLGKWVSKQKVRYHDTKDRKEVTYCDTKQHYLTQEQIDKLVAAGFDFGHRDYTRVVKSWEERYQELLVFREEHGHVDVPQRHPGLGEWVHHLRSRAKVMKLEQKEKLEAIGFKWITRAPPTKRDKSACAERQDSENEETSSSSEEEDNNHQPQQYQPLQQNPYYFHQHQQQHQQQPIHHRSPPRPLAGFASSARRWA